jgi:hypothetical protein
MVLLAGFPAFGWVAGAGDSNVAFITCSFNRQVDFIFPGTLRRLENSFSKAP